MNMSRSSKVFCRSTTNVSLNDRFRALRQCSQEASTVTAIRKKSQQTRQVSVSNSRLAQQMKNRPSTEIEDDEEVVYEEDSEEEQQPTPRREITTDRGGQRNASGNVRGYSRCANGGLRGKGNVFGSRGRSNGNRGSANRQFNGRGKRSGQSKTPTIEELDADLDAYMAEIPEEDEFHEKQLEQQSSENDNAF